MKIVPQPFWTELNFSERGRPWIQTRAGIQRQQGCSKLPIEQLISATNHICALQPSMVFCQGFPHIYAYDESSSPFMEWRYYDYGPNNRTLRYSSVVLRESGTMYLWKHGYPDTYRTSDAIGSGSDITFSLLQFDVPRIAATNNIMTDYISRYSNYDSFCLSTCVQERPMSLLDTDSDTCITPGQVSVDHSIIETTPLDDIVRTLHTVRMRNLPIVFNWSAFGDEFDVRTQISSGNGIAITSTTAINIFDLISTARTATTPGQMSYVYRAARGNETNNVNVKVRAAVKARVINNSGSASGTVRFIGPTHIGGNQCDIVVTNTSYAWIGWEYDDVYYLNAGSNYDDTATTLNKTDIHAFVSDTDVLQIIGGFACIVVE